MVQKLILGNILLDKKLYEKISVYNILYKIPTVPKPLRIRFDKIDGFILSFDCKIKHLILFDYGLFNKICDNIKYLISKKSDIANSINHNFRKIKIDSCNSLPIKKILTFQNVIILIKSIGNKNKNKYYYNIFFKKVRTKINEYLYIINAMNVMIELTFLKELMLIKQVHQRV